MLPSSIMTFWSFTQQPSTPLSVLVARATAWLIASSKLVSEIALNSVTRATLIASASLHSSLRVLVAPLICGPGAREPNIKAGARKNPAQEDGGSILLAALCEEAKPGTYRVVENRSLDSQIPTAELRRIPLPRTQVNSVPPRRRRSRELLDPPARPPQQGVSSQPRSKGRSSGRTGFGPCG